MTEKQELESSISKTIVTAIMGVLIGAVFILALINFGMGIQLKYSQKQATTASDKVFSIIAVDYSTASFDYNVANDLGGGAKLDNYLVSLYDSSLNQNYLVIRSNDMLEKVMSSIRQASGNSALSYDIEEKFFYSGSIIMVAEESDNLADFSILSVTRDEDYNIQIDAKKKLSEDNCADTCHGKAAFIKIHNIQPSNVTVNISKE